MMKRKQRPPKHGPWTFLVTVIAMAFSLLLSDGGHLHAQVATGLEETISQIYNTARNSVVNLTIHMRDGSTGIVSEGSGSGFVFDHHGHIITSSHVVREAEKIVVSLSENHVVEAQVVGMDPATDLAVIKVPDIELPPPLPVADSDALRVGQFAIAIGNSFGLRSTLTFGVISALGRVIETPDSHFISEVIQTDAPLNPGNSGGPLLDLDGQVIGINTMIFSPNGTNTGIGFAISANMLKKVIPVLIQKGSYPHPWLGVQGVDLNRIWLRIFEKAGYNPQVEEGVLVLEISADSPAEKARLQTGDRILQIGPVRIPMGGDIIVAIDDHPVSTYQDLNLYIESNTEIGQSVRVTFYRGGRKITKELEIVARPLP